MYLYRSTEIIGDLSRKVVDSIKDNRGSERLNEYPGEPEKLMKTLLS